MEIIKYTKSLKNVLNYQIKYLILNVINYEFIFNLIFIYFNLIIILLYILK